MNRPKSALLTIDRYFGLRFPVLGWSKHWVATEKYRAQMLEEAKALYDGKTGYAPWAGPSANDTPTRR